MPHKSPGLAPPVCRAVRGLCLCVIFLSPRGGLRTSQAAAPRCDACVLTVGMLVVCVFQCVVRGADVAVAQTNYSRGK